MAPPARRPAESASTVQESSASRLTRSDWLCAGIAFLLSLGLFALTSCEGLFVGDSAEIAAAALTSGVPHPPGYPVFTRLTGLLAQVVPGFLLSEDPAGAVNQVMGLYGALAIASLWLLGRRLGRSRSACCFASLSLGTGVTFWTQCTAAEVYSFDLLLLFGTLHGWLSVLRAPESRKRWVLAGLVLGLWIGHRSLNGLLALPLVVSLVVQLQGAKRAWLTPLGLAAIATVLASTLPWLLLVLASRADPAIDIGDPETLPRLWEVVRGSPYTRHLETSSFERTAARWWRFLQGGAHGLELGLAGPFALLAALHALRRQSNTRPLCLTLLALITLCVGFAGFYAVLDLEVFFLPAWASCALLAAFGWDLASQRLGSSPRSKALFGSCWLLGIPVAFLASLGVMPRGHTLTRVFAEAQFESLPENSIFLVNGDTSVHCAWFLQGVEGKRPDVVVMSLGHVVEWHLEQLRERHPDVSWPPHDPGASPSAYARALMLANIESRPVCLAPAVDGTEILRPDGARGFQLYTRGVVRQVFYTGQSFDLRKRVTENLEFFDRGIAAHLPEVAEVLEVDMDSRSTLSQFALCQFLNAEHARLGGWTDLEVRSLRNCLRFRPDLQEQLIAEDVKRGLGLVIPLNRFGERARSRLEELGESVPESLEQR